MLDNTNKAQTKRKALDSATHACFGPKAPPFELQVRAKLARERKHGDVQHRSDRNGKVMHWADGDGDGGGHQCQGYA